MQVFSKSPKLPVYWSSKIPVSYKDNAITGELNRAKRIAPDFNKELKRIRQKYRNDILPSLNEKIKFVVMNIEQAPKREYAGYYTVLLC